MEKIILIGGGGHCKSCIDVLKKINKFKIIGIIDNKIKINTKVLNYKIISNDKDLPLLRKKYKNALITVGQIKSPKTRIKLFNLLQKYKFNMPAIISKSCSLYKDSSIDKGTIIMNNSHIGPDVVIGKNCIINNKSLIEHDCKIGDHSHISTGAIINGTVKIGRGTFIGSGTLFKITSKLEITLLSMRVYT